MVYLTSDTHFGHVNILNFCHRPFPTIQEMDRTLIDNWNSVVRPDDDVYHLGDFAFGSKRYITDIVAQLNGRIHLALGNHDYKNIKKQNLEHLFFEVADAFIIDCKKFKCHLSHYPYLCWMGRYRFEPQFHGHVHLHTQYDGLDRNLMSEVAHPLQYDVGVDLNGLFPILLDDAIGKVKLQRSSHKNCYQMWCNE